MRARTRMTTVLASVALGALLLTGCAGNPIEDLVGQGVKDAIEGATGVEVDTSGESVPADFPASVPLIDGKVTGSSKITVAGASTWTVAKRNDGSVDDAFTEVKSQLVAAGLKEGFAQSQGGLVGGMFTSPDVTVMVSVTEVDGRAEVSYVVSEITAK